MPPLNMTTTVNYKLSLDMIYVMFV